MSQAAQTSNDPTEGSAPSPNGGTDGKGRALVVVNEKVSGNELRQALLSHLKDETAEIFVVAPALAASGLKYALGDIDEAIPPARERLEATLDELRDAGFAASGEVGDSDPIQAISDEILKFEPDQVLVVAHRDDEGAFAERGLLEQAERDFDIPVLELVVSQDEEPHVLDVKSSHPVAGRKKGWRPSYNWPPLSRGENFGILVAIVGTLGLGILATMGVAASDNRPDFEEGRLGAAGAALILIAMFMALINLAHIVGLLLFQSVGYRGMWSRFFARLSLFGTPLAVVAGLILYLTI